MKRDDALKLATKGYEELAAALAEGQTDFGTRGSDRRSLGRVENIGQLTPSQETVVPGSPGHVVFPRFLDSLRLPRLFW